MGMHPYSGESDGKQKSPERSAYNRTTTSPSGSISIDEAFLKGLIQKEQEPLWKLIRFLLRMHMMNVMSESDRHVLDLSEDIENWVNIQVDKAKRMNDA